MHLESLVTGCFSGQSTVRAYKPTLDIIPTYSHVPLCCDMATETTRQPVSGQRSNPRCFVCTLAQVRQPKYDVHYANAILLMKLEKQ